jgi:hypothetical protein
MSAIMPALDQGSHPLTGFNTIHTHIDCTHVVVVAHVYVVLEAHVMEAHVMEAHVGEGAPHLGACAPFRAPT